MNSRALLGRDDERHHARSGIIDQGRKIEGIINSFDKSQKKLDSFFTYLFFSEQKKESLSGNSAKALPNYPQNYLLLRNICTLGRRTFVNNCCIKMVGFINLISGITCRNRYCPSSVYSKCYIIKMCSRNITLCRKDVFRCKLRGSLIHTVSQIRLTRRLRRIPLILRKLRNRDGSQDADDRHDDQKFDQGEAFFIFSEPVHTILQ